MNRRDHQNFIYSFLVAVCLCGSVWAQDIPRDEITALTTALTASKDASSAARQRLAVKRLVRDAQKLVDAHPTAPNRFEVLGVLFRTQKQLIGLDDSSRNREAFLDTCKHLVKAPDAYAEFRLDAEILLTQTEMARQGADAEARAAALKPLIERYRDTPVEGKMLRVAMVMALELGDTKLIKALRDEMASRFAGDLEMINFQRAKLGGQVFGAPFLGTFKRNDGAVVQLPADGLGQLTWLYFWSVEGDYSVADREALATAWKKRKEELAGRANILSFNLDELPDAGESVLRELGVDWQALHLPGGRDNPLYKTFVQRDPLIMTLSPSGYAALVMSGSTRKRKPSKEASENTLGTPDFERWFQSSLAREWSRPRYINQLTSLYVGDFFVADPAGPFDPALPPEIKALSGNPTPLKRTAASVPEETLRAIQDCFALPPLRYRMPVEEIRSGYQQAEALCAKAIAAHPDAPDLWIVRNRRIVAQLGLWKLTHDRAHYQRAIKEAQAALDTGMPAGTEVLPRYCLVKETLRAPDADPEKAIADFVEAMGGASAPGPALAAASLLALHVADRGLHDEYRARILAHHLDESMLWTFTSFLLDRYHRYWLFRVPFVAGWSYGRRQNYFLSLGTPEEVSRRIQAELQTLDGKPFHLPEDSAGTWTAVLFTNSWADNPKSPIPGTVSRYLTPYAERRGVDDFQVIVAVLDGDVATLRTHLEEKPLDCPVLMVPGGINNPLVRQLGILDEDEQSNVLVLRPDGSIAVVLSGLTMSRAKNFQVIVNVIDGHDERTITALLEAGKLDEARERIFKLAPVYDPEAVDERGRKLKKPQYSFAHLRSRARVYLAMGELDAALADAEEVVKRQTGTDGGMSLRTEELDDAEALRDTIRKKREGTKG